MPFGRQTRSGRSVLRASPGFLNQRLTINCFGAALAILKAGVLFMPLRILNLAYALVIFAVWAPSVGVAQQTQPQVPQTATIIGTVLDVTGGTVPSAIVLLQGASEHR